MNEAQTFRARLRFRVQKKLNIKDREHQLIVGGREVVLSPSEVDITISESEWLVFNIKGFESGGEAKEFAGKLRAAMDISSIATRLGIDTGRDRATSSFSRMVKERVFEVQGSLLRDNVHGVDVFSDDPNVFFVNLRMTGSVLAAPDPFLADLSSLFNIAQDISPSTRDIILLLNFALLRPEPVAQIVFAFSAVEMLGQQENWSDSQKRLLDKLAAEAEKSELGSEDERHEVAVAIRRGIPKIGLRQGVVRLLKSLQLEHLRNRWDELYDRRSALVHGLAPRPEADYSQLAYDTVSLCGQILLSVVAREVASANRHVDKYYSI